MRVSLRNDAPLVFPGGHCVELSGDEAIQSYAVASPASGGGICKFKLIPS